MKHYSETPFVCVYVWERVGGVCYSFLKPFLTHLFNLTLSVPLRFLQIWINSCSPLLFFCLLFTSFSSKVSSVLTSKDDTFRVNKKLQAILDSQTWDWQASSTPSSRSLFNDLYQGSPISFRWGPKCVNCAKPRAR